MFDRSDTRQSICNQSKSTGSQVHCKYSHTSTVKSIITGKQTAISLNHRTIGDVNIHRDVDNSPFAEFGLIAYHRCLIRPSYPSSSRAVVSRVSSYTVISLPYCYHCGNCRSYRYKLMRNVSPQFAVNTNCYCHHKHRRSNVSSRSLSQSISHNVVVTVVGVNVCVNLSVRQNCRIVTVIVVHIISKLSHIISQRTVILSGKRQYSVRDAVTKHNRSPIKLGLSSSCQL